MKTAELSGVSTPRDRAQCRERKSTSWYAFAKDFGAKGLAYIAIQEDGTVKSSFAKFMTEEEMNALIQAMDGENGDLLLFAADKNKVVWDVLGNLRLELARQMELLDKNEYKFLWITEFPLLEWNEDAEPLYSHASPIHHADGGGSAVPRHRSGQGPCKSLRYRAER